MLGGRFQCERAIDDRRPVPGARQGDRDPHLQRVLGSQQLFQTAFFLQSDGGGNY